MMLNLAIAQIAGTLEDGDESVASLANAFTSMVGNVESAQTAAEALPASVEKNTIIENCEAVNSEMQHAIMAFQFYDKLNQRLSHVSSSLAVLADVVSDPAKLYDPLQWRELQRKIQSKYTVESDRLMFDYILSGRSIEEALAMAKQDALSVDSEDGVELF